MQQCGNISTNFTTPTKKWLWTEKKTVHSQSRAHFITEVQLGNTNMNTYFHKNKIPGICH